MKLYLQDGPESDEVARPEGLQLEVPLCGCFTTSSSSSIHKNTPETASLRKHTACNQVSRIFVMIFKFLKFNNCLLSLNLTNFGSKSIMKFLDKSMRTSDQFAECYRTAGWFTKKYFGDFLAIIA